MEGFMLSPFPSLPSLATDMRIVDGVQLTFLMALRQVSRAKTSVLPFVSPATKLLARD
jgi:hypothetical protein